MNKPSLTFINTKNDAIFEMSYVKTRFYWIYTPVNNIYKTKAILRGDSMRFNNEDLRDRFDSKNTPWIGYKEIDI